LIADGKHFSVWRNTVVVVAADRETRIDDIRPSTGCRNPIQAAFAVEN